MSPLQPPPDFRDAESTSAALRRVEAQRDEARIEWQRAVRGYEQMLHERDAATRRSILSEKAAAEAYRQRDIARAELASARQELDLLRTDHTPIEAPGMSALTDEEFAALNADPDEKETP